MLGPISKVQTTSKFDALAEIPLVGSVSSAVRLSVNALSLVYNILKYPMSSDKSKCLKNMNLAVIQIGKGLAEIIPIFGNFVAVRLNKREDTLRKLYEDIDTIKEEFKKTSAVQEAEFKKALVNLTGASPSKKEKAPGDSALPNPAPFPLDPASFQASSSLVFCDCSRCGVISPKPILKEESKTKEIIHGGLNLPDPASPIPKPASSPTNPASSQAANSSLVSSPKDSDKELAELKRRRRSFAHDKEIEEMTYWDEAQLKAEKNTLELDPSFLNHTQTEVQQNVHQAKLVKINEVLDFHRMSREMAESQKRQA